MRAGPPAPLLLEGGVIDSCVHPTPAVFPDSVAAAHTPTLVGLWVLNDQL